MPRNDRQTQPIVPPLSADRRQVDPDHAAKRSEIDRFCGPKSNVEEEFHTIVRYMGEETLKNPHFRATAQQLLKLIGMEDQEDGTDIISKIVFKGRHEALQNFYKAAPQDCGFRISLPTPHEQTLKDTYDKRNPYVLWFLKGIDVAGPVISIWQKMVHSRDDIREINLLYDTSAPGVTCGAESSGHWSGSGEVAAACLISQRIARLSPQIEITIKRWCDIGESQTDFQRNGCSQIILGSSIGVFLMGRIRQRRHLKGRQVYSFKARKDKSQPHGYILRELTEDGVLQQKELTCSEASQDTISEEFALVSFFRDPVNKQSLIALQGITTVGTRAAAKFMCTPEGIAILTQAFKDQGCDISGHLPSFELLLRVEVEGIHTLGEVTFEELVIHDQNA